MNLSGSCLKEITLAGLQCWQEEPGRPVGGCVSGRDEGGLD